MSGPEGRRCFLCGARALRPSERTLVFAGRPRRYAVACDFCGLLIADGAEDAAARTHLVERLGADVFHADEAAPYGLDVYTLRIAATLRSRGIEPIGPEQAAALRRPHSALAAAARLFDLGPAGLGVSLGILCRPHEVAGVCRALSADAGWTDEVVILVDDAAADTQPIAVGGMPPGAVRLGARPLGDDFAAQRNALQALSRNDWILQLDADETLSPGTGGRLGALVKMAQAQGVRSIGLPRRNLVDGVLSDLYPDTQYRLNHRGVRFDGRVHERPARPWQQSMIALQGAILHQLGRAHVETRSQRYEAMTPGGGRLEEAERLLQPYRA